MRKANAIATLFGILIENKGFGNFLGGEFYDLFMIGIREILFGHRGDGSRIGVKDPQNILDPNILIISYVKVHCDWLFLYDLRDQIVIVGKDGVNAHIQELLRLLGII